MSTTAEPHPSGDTAKARTAAALEDTYPDWAITVDNGRFTARHRHEEYNARREQWGMVKTTVFADTPEQMRDRLSAQQALRATDEAKPR